MWCNTCALLVANEINLEINQWETNKFRAFFNSKLLLIYNKLKLDCVLDFSLPQIFTSKIESYLHF
jgi:hypothetical protein